MKPLTEEQRSLAADPEWIDFARRIATGYVRRFPWHAEEIESAAMWGLCVAAATYDPTGEYPFRNQVWWRVRAAIVEAFRLSYPMGHRWQYQLSQVGVGPSTVCLRGPVDSGDDPVGWEIEYQDELECLSHRVSDPISAMAIRCLYGQAAMDTHAKVAAAIGCNKSTITRKVGRAVAKIAKRFERETYADAVLAGKASR